MRQALNIRRGAQQTRIGTAKSTLSAVAPRALSVMLFIAAIPALSRAQSTAGQSFASQLAASQSGANQWASQPPTWQTTAGGKREFDVASVKQNNSGDRPNANLPLDDGDAYAPNGGLFRATSLPLIVYLIFAYKINANEYSSLQSELPKWAAADLFDIEARADGSPTKDQMRLMMQSLLADRFKLAVHTETRQLPVLAIALVKPWKTGPQLLQHSDDPPCVPAVPLPPGSAMPLTAGGLPAICGVLSRGGGSAASGHIHLSGRNMTLGVLGSDLGSIAQVGRPVLDRTGLHGTFDFTVDWIPEVTGPRPPGADALTDSSGPTFFEALKDQLGLKLEPQTGPVDVLVIDHIEKPSPN
jgi:bla regulator protein blaR1